MDDGFDGGRLGGGLEGFSMLRSAATERLRQALGPQGLAEASPLSLAELANDTLEEMVAQRSDKPSMLEQRRSCRNRRRAARREGRRRGRRPGRGRRPTPPPRPSPASIRSTIR
jgi:hypothetical protein